MYAFASWEQEAGKSAGAEMEVRPLRIRVVQVQWLCDVCVCVRLCILCMCMNNS